MTATGKDFKQQMHAWAERQARARWDREHGAAWAAYEAALRQQQEAERQARDAPDRDDAGEEAQEEEGPAPQDVPELEDPLDDAQHDASAPLAAAAALPPLPSPPPPFTFNTSALPRLRVVHHHIPDHDLPRFYKAADCFVLPSRGEGWGRPHVEAMSMGLSVIATNWSGVTAFLDETTGYPIKVCASGFARGAAGQRPLGHAFVAWQWPQTAVGSRAVAGRVAGAGQPQGVVVPRPALGPALCAAPAPAHAPRGGEPGRGQAARGRRAEAHGRAVQPRGHRAAGGRRAAARE